MKELELLKDLNPQQKEAVIHEKGPLLIIAGAGTGKTRVITKRIAYLIASKKAEPHEILALTFTEKAAAEMEERADILIPYGYADIWVSTFHAFGERILSEKAIELGLDTNFKVLTAPEQAVFIKEHLFEFPMDYYRPLGNPNSFIKALVTLFSRARDEDVSPQEYLELAKDLEKQASRNAKDMELCERAKKEMEIALCYQKYQELKAQRGMIDFGDQFYLTLQLFREHPSILREYQKRFKYILVDEFQDTNYAQFELIKLLASEHKNITVSADDDQSIYKFRGAAISNVLGFLKTYKKSKKVILVNNYRSSQAILDASYMLVSHNNPDRLEIKADVNKKLIALTKGKKQPEHLHYDTISHEADEVAKMIKSKVEGDENISYDDIAILVRSNNDAEPFLQALNMLLIPWRFTGNQGLYSRQEIRLAISFLKIIADIKDSVSLFYLASSEIYNLDMVILSLCNSLASRRNITLYEVFKMIDTVAELSEIPEDELKKIKRLITDIEHYVEASRDLVSGNILYMFLTETGYLKKLTSIEDRVSEAKIKNLARFFEIVKEFSSLTDKDRVFTFIKHLEMLIASGDDPAVVEADLDIEAVNVLTVHKAKGLEFRVVFMVSLIKGKFPWPKRREALALPDELVKDILPAGDFFLQEERRLFYVAMTRAKEELYLTSARDYGGKRQRKISVFILEALDLPQADIEPFKSSALEAIKRHTPKAQEPEFKSKSIQEKLIDLTAYKIDDYLTCPLKYRYIHVLRVPILQHHSIIYGKILHEVVAEYFRYKMNNKKISLNEILDYYENIWVNEGYLTKEHEIERFQTGRKTIENFYKREEGVNKLPSFLEESFKFVMNDSRISGRFDRLDEDKKEAIIIDYKSSNITDQKKADKRAKESIQMNLYALAYKEKKGRLPDKIELHFLESGLVGSAVKKEDDIDKVKLMINEVSAGLRQQNYKAKPTYMACQYCPYKQICPRTLK
ncbi:MAG: ATP-dependent DNA helicase [Candidatus Kappaea frigidicola]|nr:ATP-dependent DNA helicase [Candidatus Kappaea frigidicola]